MLYSENKFSYVDTSDGLTSMGAVWLSRLGNFNIGLVKSLTLRIPWRAFARRDRMRITGERAWASMSFSFAENLPNQLEHITVGCTLSRWRGSITNYPRGRKQCPRTRSKILLLASIITKMHPTIKKAVWQAENGVKYEDEQAFCTNHDMYIRLGPAGKTSSICTTTYRALNGEWVDKKDIVLDCGKIRALNWRERELCDELDFALPDDALSSEFGTMSPDESDEWYLENYRSSYLHRPSLSPGW